MAAALERRKVQRQTAYRATTADAPEGTVVVYEKTLPHPMYGDIHLIIDSSMQEDMEVARASLCALRRIPIDHTAEGLKGNDPFIMFYTNMDFPEDHAREMAAAAWAREAEDARNTAAMLAAFKYVDFEGEVPPYDGWQTPEEMAIYDQPPRPVRMEKTSTERRVNFVQDLLQSGATPWPEDPDAEEDAPERPTFSAMFWESMREIMTLGSELIAEGEIDGEEPVDPDGFQGESAGGDVPAEDDAGGEEPGKQPDGATD
jgi:hypothetical protein